MKKPISDPPHRNLDASPDGERHQSGSQAGRHPAAGAGLTVESRAVIEKVAHRLHAEGGRMTAARRAVLTALAENEGPLTAERVGELVAADTPAVHLATVYRTLEQLEQLGVVQHTLVGRGGSVYLLAREPRHHLQAQCRQCGRITELPMRLMDPVKAAVRDDFDFTLHPCHVALTGVCGKCRRSGEAGGTDTVLSDSPAPT